MADGAVSTGQGIWALGKGLATDFPGVSSQMANGVVALLSGRGQEPDTEQQAQSFLYFLQGNEIASVRLAAKSATEFALAMIPAGRAGAAAKVGEIAAGEGAAAGLLSGGAKGGPSEAVAYFRVEGGGSGTKTSQNRITANEDGTITINPGCKGQICVSVGNADHATYYLTNKRPDGSVVVFDVDAGLHKEIMDKVVPQRPVAGMTKDPNAPKRVDKDQPGYSIELPKIWESLLEKNSSNARVYTQDEFFKEFKQ